MSVARQAILDKLQLNDNKWTSNRRTVLSVRSMPRCYNWDGLGRPMGCKSAQLKVRLWKTRRLAWNDRQPGSSQLKVRLWRRDKEDGVKWPPAWELISWSTGRIVKGFVTRRLSQCSEHRIWWISAVKPHYQEMSSEDREDSMCAVDTVVFGVHKSVKLL
jgi:hypothetical protein